MRGTSGEAEGRGTGGGAREVRGTKVRGTRQAAALVAALDNLPGFCSAQQIHAELRRRGEHIGLTTVYRHLQVLSEEAASTRSGTTTGRPCTGSASPAAITTI